MNERNGYWIRVTFYKRLFCQVALCGVIAAFLAGCATKPPPKAITQVGSDVFFGGTYLVAGSMNDVKPRFPALSGEMSSPAWTELLDTVSGVFKTRSNEFTQIKLRGFDGVRAPDDAIVIGCGFTGEKHLITSFSSKDGDRRIVTAYLSGGLFLQNFERSSDGASEVKLLRCYPFSLSCSSEVPKGSSYVDVGGQLLLGAERGLRSGEFSSIISQIASNVAPVTGVGATMQIGGILWNKTCDQLVSEKFNGNEKDFRQWLAVELGSELARRIGIPMIPYVEDTSTRRMAQVMSNEKAYDIKLPDPAFVMDVELTGFSEALAKKTATESMWVFGAYAKVAVREFATRSVRWEKNVKVGVARSISANQTGIDHTLYQFNALLDLQRKIADDMRNDKAARPIIDACLK